MSDDMPELKPCPFCGNDNIEDWGEVTWARPIKWMYCTECLAHSPHVMRDRDEDFDVWMQLVVSAWNTRADLAKEPAPTVGVTLEAALALPEIKALVEALQFYRDGFRAVKNTQGRLEWRPKEALLDDCGQLALEALAALKGGA